VQGGLVEDLDGARGGEHGHHRGRLLQRELVEQVGHVRCGQVGHDLPDADEALVQAHADALDQVLGCGHGGSP
jgi:hypothetical protein